MKSTKILNLIFEDEGKKIRQFQISNPKDDISLLQAQSLQNSIVENETFLGKAGKIKSLKEAYYRETTVTDLI